MTDCVYHPIYRSCRNCGADMERGQARECSPPVESPRELLNGEGSARIDALRQARALIQKHAMSTWKGGLIERSDGITEVLVDFDLAFPEALDP